MTDFEVTINFNGCLRIGYSDVSRAFALKDAMNEWIKTQRRIFESSEDGIVDVNLESVKVNMEKVIFRPFTEFEETKEYTCEVCGDTFEKVKCDTCEYRSGQCTGQHENKMCQECCADDFRDLIVVNPLANVLRESV